MCLLLRGVRGQGLGSAHICVPLSAGLGEKLHGSMSGDEVLLSGSASPVHREELSGGIDERGSPLSRKLRGEQVERTVAMGFAGQIIWAR